MARNRRQTPRRQTAVWRVGRYIRLSREDGGEVSESVVNQDKILTDELPAFFDGDAFEIVETYVDDGTSGTTDAERAAFRRMVRDVETGRINCVAVKNLSRAFRNSANQGKFLEEFIPLYHARFISLYQPRIDTLLDPESVHSLEVGITGFLNEQYAYKTSCDVRRTLKRKRERGEFVGAFAPYGYDKDPLDKNALVPDEEAAAVVREIYRRFVYGGMSKAGIARTLNDLGVPSPAARRREKGGGGAAGGLWSAEAVSRVLQNPIYVGTLVQGKQRVVSYKVHRLVRTEEAEWSVVEHAAPPLIDEGLFAAAQALCRRDTRTPPERREVNLFAGFLRCADCGRAMARRVIRGRVSFVCRTYREQSKTACTRHSVRLDVLERTVLVSLRTLAALAPESADGARDEPSAAPDAFKKARGALTRTLSLLDDAYCDWRGGTLSDERYRRTRARLEERAALLRAETERLAAAQNAPPASASAPAVESEPLRLTRDLLAALLCEARVRADGSLDLVFAFPDPFRAAAGGA